MWSANTRARPRAVVLLGTALVAATLAAGCGSDDGGDGATAAKPTAAAGSAEQQIRTLFDEVQKAFYAGDGEKTCELFSATARKEAAEFGRYDSCVRNMAALGKASQSVADRAPNIVSVTVEGDEATAVIKKPRSDNPPEKAAFVKVDGVWKVEHLRDSRTG